MDAAADGTQLTIAYYDLAIGGVGFAVGLPNADDSVSWAHERVEGYPEPSGIDTVDVGKYASHRTAPDGTTWLAYQDVRNGKLRVAHRTGLRRWDAPVEVDVGGAWTDLAIDGSGQPVVVHCDPDSAQLRLARFDGTRWLLTTLYTSTAVGERPAGVSHSRVVSRGGEEFVAFRDDAKGALLLVDVEGAATTLTEVDADGDVGAWPSLVHEGGTLSIAYHDVGNQHLRLATRNAAGDWRRSVIDEGQLRGADTEVFVGEGGRVSIAYFDGMSNDLLLAERGADGWGIRQVATEGAVGYHNEVAFTSARWWAATYDQTRRSLVVTPL